MLKVIYFYFVLGKLNANIVDDIPPDDSIDTTTQEGSTSRRPDSEPHPGPSTGYKRPADTQTADIDPTNPKIANTKTSIKTDSVPSNAGQSTTVSTATNITQGKSTTDTSSQPGISGSKRQLESDIPEAPGVKRHQVDTPSGPFHNTKGSVPGEAGNRKIQKPELRWGIIAVSTMSLYTVYIFGFTSHEHLTNYLDLLDFHYSKSETIIFKTKMENHLKVLVEAHWCITKFGFNISYKTLGDKFGEILTIHAKYAMTKSISNNWNDEKGIKEYFNKGLSICFKNNANLMSFEDCIAREIQRKNYTASTSTYKPRKRTYSDD